MLVGMQVGMLVCWYAGWYAGMLVCRLVCWYAGWYAAALTLERAFAAGRRRRRLSSWLYIPGASSHRRQLDNHDDSSSCYLSHSTAPHTNLKTLAY